jgi:ABC-type amino acid transport substrate-binding protein
MTGLGLVTTVCAVVVAVAGCASTGGQLAGGGTLDKIKTTRTLALGYRESSVPFSFVGQDGKPAGYSVDLCTRIATDLQRQLGLSDLQVTWVPVTVESRVPAVVRGTIDLECGSTTNTLSRQEQVDFSLTTFLTGGSLLARVDSNLDETRQGVRVAVIPGTTTERVLKESLAKLAANVQFVPVKDHAEGLAALQERTADAYASDRAILIGLLGGASPSVPLVLADRYYSYEPYGLMLRRGDPDFRLAVNRVLARLYRSGQITDIYNRWFGQFGGPAPQLLLMYGIEGLPE